MKDIIIGELLKRSVAYKPIIGKAFGSVNLGVMWCQILFWSTHSETSEGWVKKSWQQLFFETGLSRQEQRSARSLGEKLGVLETEQRGYPRETHWRISQEKTLEVVEGWLTKNPAQTDRMGVEVHQGLFGKEIKVKRAVAKIELPEWLNAEAWAAWEKYREEKGKKLTESSRKLQWKFLKMHEADHVEIINTSIQNGWQGLFVLKKQPERRQASNAPKPTDGRFTRYG